MKMRILVIFFTLSVTICEGNMLKDKIYTEVDGDSIRSCFRRLNGTSTIGCTSDIGGDVGVLIYLDTIEDVSYLHDDQFAPYTVLVNPSIFGGDLLDQLQKLGHVSGVIL